MPITAEALPGKPRAPEILLGVPPGSGSDRELASFSVSTRFIDDVAAILMCDSPDSKVNIMIYSPYIKENYVVVYPY
jgi:hypothetical protein